MGVKIEKEKVTQRYAEDIRVTQRQKWRSGEGEKG
jgi:hypothetical protein